MTQCQTFSSEKNINSPQYQKEIANFWSTVKQDVFEGKNEIQLAWCKAINPDSEKAIVISSGRVESYLKYQELIFDLYHQGFSVYAMDHRGQGLSERLTKNLFKGHVDKFGDYIDDFAKFVNTIVLPDKHKAHYLVGHSMGGAIATLYLQENPQIFKAAVLSSPMYGIKLPVFPFIIRSLANLLDTYKKGREPNYVLGGKDYQSLKFSDNELTNSPARYHICKNLYDNNPKIQLGAPTNHWLLESLTASKEAITAAETSLTPILILQAENDTVVDNRCHNRAISQQCQKLVIPGAKHEIYIETDNRRNMALNAMISFFNKYQ